MSSKSSGHLLGYLHRKKQLTHYVMREGVAINIYRIAQSLTYGFQLALSRSFSATVLRIPGRFDFVLERAGIYIATTMLAAQVSSYALRLWYGDITLRHFVKISVVGLITVGASLIRALLATILCPPAEIAGGIIAVVSSITIGAISRWALDKFFPDGEEEEITVVRKTYY